MTTKSHEAYIKSLRSLSSLSLLQLFYNLSPNLQNDKGCKQKDVASFDGEWFTHGIRGYYADLLNLRNGVISEEEYVKKLNNLMLNYFAIYSTIEGFFTNPCSDVKLDTGVMNYTTKFLALNLDSVIQQKSFQKKNLDSFLKGMFIHCWEYPCSFSKEQFINAFFVPEDLGLREVWIGHLLEKYIIAPGQFKPGNMPAFIMDGKYQLMYKDLDNVIVPGLNLSELMCTFVVNGIDEESAAFKAGLRNGDVMTELKSHFSYEGDSYIELKILNKDGTTKTIKYEPIGKGKVPYYAKRAGHNSKESIK